MIQENALRHDFVGVEGIDPSLSAKSYMPIAPFMGLSLPCKKRAGILADKPAMMHV